MGFFIFVKEAGEKLFGRGEAKAAEQAAKADPTPVNLDALNAAAGAAIANLIWPPGNVSHEAVEFLFVKVVVAAIAMRWLPPVAASPTSA